MTRSYTSWSYWRALALVFAVLVAGTGARAELGKLAPLNVSSKLPGTFFARSRVGEEALRTDGGSNNVPAQYQGELGEAEGPLVLMARPAERAPFEEVHAGMRVLLVNASAEEQAIVAADGRLPILLEALIGKGEWRTVEYLPTVRCGNSFHTVRLEARDHWSFTAPVYAGKIPVRLRFVLRSGDREPVYSNDFEGRINPSQLVRQPGPHLLSYPPMRVD